MRPSLALASAHLRGRFTQAAGFSEVVDLEVVSLDFDEVSLDEAAAPLPLLSEVLEGVALEPEVSLEVLGSVELFDFA